MFHHVWHLVNNNPLFQETRVSTLCTTSSDPTYQRQYSTSEYEEEALELLKQSVKKQMEYVEVEHAAKMEVLASK